MATHNILGSWGERLAREHLLRQGYTIVDSNVKIGHNEIDFIATFRNRIIFVEVKTRSDDFADPLDAIDSKKIIRLCRAADAYIQAYSIPHDPQFDVIIIIGNPLATDTTPKITHIPDAFRPPLSKF